ncbi:hypothetical protein AKJ09_09545 [Labilithrix luteola]|uniref:SWIM-type domain-containing protein n=1 Tax=Labilithrix luteola TaxID=1391654 RepID=A0A0K1QB40_9BACT|nr:SWIM zinc finger family protein [Labilithrix luteola]AKV02882.1 hypothetical protein AKJ09_09545 [Labilithrix luteola]
MTTQTSPSARPTLTFPARPPRPARPASVAIRIADRLGPHFAPNACVAGYGYFANGRVVLALTSETSGHATVRGKRTQTVHLEANDGELATSCSCASNALEMTGCRHVWAAVLEADRTGAFASLRASPKPLKMRARTEPRPTSETPGEKPKNKAAQRAQRAQRAEDEKKHEPQKTTMAKANVAPSSTKVTSKAKDAASGSTSARTKASKKSQPAKRTK